MLDYNIMESLQMSVQPVLIFGKKMTRMNGWSVQTVNVECGVMQIVLNKVNKPMFVCYAKLASYDRLLNIVLTVYF